MRHRVLFLACLTLAGCTGQTTGGLSDDAGEAAATWLVLDLETGAISGVAEADASDPQWRGSRILFRQLPPGSGSVGRPLADDLTEADEHPARLVSTSRVWIAACELSQRQWFMLAGTTPWFQALPFGDLDHFVSPERPALGLSPELVLAALPRWSTSGWRLDLPNQAEWEHACLAGGSGKFAWGDGYAASDAQDWAVCDASGSGNGRPAALASKRPNAWGIYDMHGNAWEIVHAGNDSGWELRGGAFDQPPLACRASNHLVIEAETTGWSIGARLVLRR